MTPFLSWLLVAALACLLVRGVRRATAVIRGANLDHDVYGDDERAGEHNTDAFERWLQHADEACGLTSYAPPSSYAPESFPLDPVDELALRRARAEAHTRWFPGGVR